MEANSEARDDLKIVEVITVEMGHAQQQQCNARSGTKMAGGSYIGYIYYLLYISSGGWNERERDERSFSQERSFIGVLAHDYLDYITVTYVTHY